MFKQDNYGKYWYNEKKQCHRTDGPAIKRISGSKEYWKNGKLIKTVKNKGEKKMKKNQLTPAQKAVKTRKARDAFADYNLNAYDVVRLSAQGKSVSEISDQTSLSVASVAAHKANLTRGVYDKRLKDCNF